MDQGKELEQEELNIVPTPVIEICQLSESSASSSSGLGIEENKNSKVSDASGEGNVAELQLQNIPITSFSPQLGIENLEVTKVASFSAETLSNSLKEGHKVDFKMSDSHLLCKGNATEIDKGCKKTGDAYTVENVASVDLTVTGSLPTLENVAFVDLTGCLPTLENVAFIDLTMDSGDEQQTELQMASSAMITWKASGKHVAKSRHVPYSAKLSRHMHLRTISCVDEKSIDHVSAHVDSHADLITTEKFGTTDVTEILLSIGEAAALDLKSSTGPMTKFSTKKLEIKTDILADAKDTCQSNEPMSTSLRIEVDLDCPLVDDDLINTSSVFENMSLRVSDEDANLIRDDVSSSETTAAGIASIKLLGECEQSYSVSVNALKNVQQQGGSAITAKSSVLSKNGSAPNLSMDAPHTSSVANNTVTDMQQSGSAVNVHASKGTEQQQNSDMTTSTSNNMQPQTCNSADTFKNMPLNVTNDSMKNIQNSISTSSSKNVQQTIKSANPSKDLQKENRIDVIPSNVQQRISATDASENKGPKVNATAALKKMEQKSSNAINLSSNAKQSSSAVDASKNKEKKFGSATSAAKSIQQQNSSATDFSENVEQFSISATLSKIRQTTSNAGNLLVTIQQQSGSAARLDNVQPPKRIVSDFPKETQQVNACTKLSQTVQKQSGPVFKNPNVLKPIAQGENINSCAQVPSRKMVLSQVHKVLKKTETNKSVPSLLSVTNIQYQPLQDCQDLLELASCKTTDYRVQRGKPKRILEESSRANTFERFKRFQFSRATDNDVLELYGRLPMSLPEDLEETPMCKEDVTDFTSKKNRVQDLEKVLHYQRY